MMETIKASNICCLDAPFAFSGEKRNINKYFSKLSSIVLLTFLSVSLFGQYSETFSIANKGILIGPCTTNDPTTCASFDFTGVNWTIEGNLSGLVSGAGGTTDDFQTSGGVLTSSGDIDEEICWVSPMLTISGTPASFSCDISWIGGYNDGDYLDVEYNVNGGGWTTVTSLPQSGGGHTINGFSTPTPELPDGSSTVAVNSLGASGQTLQIRMCVDFNSFSESFTLDNVIATNAVVPSPDPELDVRNEADDADIVDGASSWSVTNGTDYGNVCFDGSSSVTHTFRAENNGAGTLTFGADALAMTNNTDFTIITDLPNNGTVAPGGVATFSIRYLPNTSGTRTSTVTIRSDDADEDPYTFIIRGFGIPEPTIANAGADQNVVGTSTSLEGNTATSGTGMWSIISGSGGTIFSSNSPTSNFSGIAGTTYTLRWTISRDPCTPSTDDVDITFTAPELDVRNAADNADITDGSTTISSALGTDFGSVCATGGTASSTFRAENNGISNLTLGGTALAISNTTDFSITTNLINNYMIAPNGWELFTIQFDPASPGIKTCTVTIRSDDADEDPYTFLIQGVGLSDNTVAPASSSPTVCFNETITPITHTTTGATGIGAATGLPPGTSAAFTANTITINGAPTATGTFNYSIPLTGGCGTVNATGTITIPVDNTDPVANCPMNITVGNDMGQCDAVVNFTIQAPTDNCPGATSAAVPASGSTFSVGTTTVTVTATDASMNTGTCTFNVTVNDTEDPVIVGCQGGTYPNTPGQCGAQVAFAEAGATDNCDTDLSYSFNPPTGSFFPVGVTMVEKTAMDDAGNSATCMLSVTVNDTENPVANCPPTQTVNNDPGQCNAVVNFMIPDPTDNCPGATSTANPPSGSTFPVGTSTVTVTATDAVGNMATCLFNVVVNDIENPIANCPPTHVTFNDPGQCEAIVNFLIPNPTTGNCPGATSSASPASGSAFPLGTTPVTVTAIDAAGNMSTCMFNIVVNDSENPVANCPADINVAPNAAGCMAIVNYPATTPSDNCPGATMSFMPPSGSNFPIGTTTVTGTAIDASGNMSTTPCTFTVFVSNYGLTCMHTDETCAGANDGTATVIPLGGTMPHTYQWDAAAGNQTTQTATGLAPGLYSVTVTDAYGCPRACALTIYAGSVPCCPSSVSITANPSGDICLGTMGVQYNAVVTDGAATNTFAWCAFNNGTGSGTCFNGFSDNTAQDPTRNWTSSAGPKSVGVTVSQAGCLDITDLYVFNVVADPVAPIIVRNPDTDACVGSTLTVDVTPGSGGIGTCLDEYRYSTDNGVNWSAWGTAVPSFAAADNTNLVESRRNCDGAGCNSNVNQVSWTIAPDPVVTCPTAAVTLECGASLDPSVTGLPITPTTICCTNAPTVMIDDDSVPGNCLPSTETITRTFMVGYDCGYSTTCTQVITLEDNTPPLIVTCPDDQTIEWPTGFNTYLVGPNTPQDPSIDPSNYNNMVYSEACGSVTITYQDVLTGPNPGNCPNLWVVERTWTVTDQCNQSTQCVQTFTFTDTTPPTISCPADPAPIEWPAGFNTAAVGPNTPQDPSVAPAVYGTATASDNCGTPTVTYQDVLFGPVPGDCPNLWTLQRTWTATDACGLTATCVQVFTFTDTTPPVITTCPPAVAIEGCGLGDIAGNGHPPYSTVVAGTEAEFSGSGGVASDNCAIVAWNYVDVASGTCPATVTRTWTVTDACGLTATCTQVFTIDDTTPPLVTCQDISVSLGANGTYNLQPTEVLASASDNCGGAVTPVSVSPSIFDCQSFPNNTVTLTVEDACGNPGTCTANVYVAPFITNVIGVHTNETCAGANDGTITASATAGGGQVMYSVDGVNFQAVGSFNNLAPGLQTLTIKVFGVPATCVETLVFDIQPGGPLLVCYADSDNDGYGSSIAPPVTTCNCPAGYKTAAQLGGNTNNDCNDGNALINPGAAEICDGLDNDCDGVVPADEVDADGDGYRVCDNDCNDTNPAINPGAAEICNGIDDNCNGMVDEGLNGLTYNGNVYFSTQAQVNAWPPCYSVINGSVTIVGVGINNLGPLSNIVDITGGLTIQSTGLTSMSGLDGLAHVGGTLTIYFNSSLTTLNGLEALNAVGGALYMYYNFQLNDCCAISDLVSGGVTGPMLVFFNKIGCNSVMEIITTCPAAPLVGNPNTVIGTQAATGATYGKVGAAAVSVYPNPVRSVLTVNIAAELLSGTLQVTDVTGRTRTIVELVEGQSNYNVDASQFGAGLYFVTVKTEGAEPVVKRFVVE